MPEGAAPNRSPDPDRVVRLDGVTVRFEVIEDRVTSFKEYVLSRLVAKPANRELLALDGVDLEVVRGEMVGVVGRNGAGKTTLLRVAAGVLSPTEGRVRTRGTVVPLLGVGAGFQADLSGRENTLLALTMLGIPRRRAAGLVEEVAEFSELGPVMDRPLRQYSSGMVARLGFAVGTAERADLLLLDEVLAVGDERFQEKCLTRIGHHCADGTSVILVSHSATAISHCRRAVWVRDGRIAADGCPGEVLAEYRHETAGERVQAAVPTEPLPPGRPHPDLPENELLEDRALVSLLKRRCGDPSSSFHAVRVFAELRNVVLLRGFDPDRVLEIGPRSLPLVSVCFAAAGASRVATVSGGGTPDREDLELLKAYLAAVSGLGWWRFAAEVYPGGTLESDLFWNNVDLERRAASVERLEVRTSGQLPCADASFTLAYSVDSLAHVADPRQVIDECARVLASGGAAIHDIVLCDVDNPEPLAELRCTEEEWPRRLAAREDTAGMYDVPPGTPPELAYGHRWRASDFVAAMEDAGFEDIVVEPLIRIRPETVDRERLAEPFRSKTEDDLATLVARISGRLTRSTHEGW